MPLTPIKVVSVMAMEPPDDDLQDFIRRADMVQKQVEALAKGELAPGDALMPGQDNWAYASASARQASLALKQAESSSEEHAKAVVQHKKWDAQRAARLGAEEADRWWRFARMQYGEGGVNAPAAAERAEESSSAAAPLQPRWRYGDKGAIDYSWWDKWAVNPDDEVTVAEAKRLAEEKERAESEAFEKANPGFCMGFRKDELERAAADRAKAKRAEDLKARGNEFFTKKDFPAALGRYHEALRLAPFSAAVLNNIAATHLALGDAEAAKEFCTRTLHIELFASSPAVKALFRRAAAARALGDAGGALGDLTLAAKGDPKNTEVAAALLEARSEVEECEKEARVAEPLRGGGGLGGGGGGGSSTAAVPPLPTSPAAAPPSSSAVLLPAPPSLAADGLPSNAAISDSVALADMALPGLLARVKSRLESLPGCAPEGPQRNAELRALSRELREVAGKVDSDDGRVRVRVSGVLGATSELAVDIAAAVERAAGSGEGAAPAHPQALALSTMAVLASVFLVLKACQENLKNRTLFRQPFSESSPSFSSSGASSSSSSTAIPRDSVLSTALYFLAAKDGDSAAAWARAFGGDAKEVVLWQGQLLSPLAAFVEAFSKPAACDPLGRASLACSPYVASGLITRRLWQCIKALREAPPSSTPIGCMETLHATASTLQFLASFDHSATLLTALSGGAAAARGSPAPSRSVGPAAAAEAAGPFAPMIRAVNDAVAGLAQLAASHRPPASPSSSASAAAPAAVSLLQWDDTGSMKNPIPVLIQGILALMGRALIDSMPSLTAHSGGRGGGSSSIGEQATFFHSPALLSIVGALSNLCAHEPFAMYACKTATVPSSTSAAAAAASAAALPSFPGKSTGGKGPSPNLHTCDFVLYPLLDILRLRPPPVSGPSSALAPLWNTIRASACSALANACSPAITGSPAALEAISSAGGIAVLLGVLREGGVDEGRAALSSRASMLLGRVASSPSGEAALLTPAIADSVLGLLKLFAGAAPAPSAGEEGDGGMLVDGLLRCLAVCAGGSASGAASSGGSGATATHATAAPLSLAPRLLAGGACSTVVAALRSALETLQTGFKGKRIRTVGVGNALKILIALAELVAEGGGGEAAGRRLLEEGACEVATAALMCPGKEGDPNTPLVRRNAGTAVAKLSRNSACYERLKSLRAMEALMQLKELR